MANTYPSLSVKGMIYIHSGSPQICATSINLTRETCSIRTHSPLYPACNLKRVYIIAMTGHYRDISP